MLARNGALSQLCGGWACLEASSCRIGRDETPACVEDETLQGTFACLCASWRPSARGRDGDGGQRRSVSCQLLLHPPASDLAMRAALDIDGGHAPHEGSCVLARL